MSDLRWTIRWHLKQRRPRPALPTGVELVASAAHAVLATTAIIFTIGG